VIRELLGTYRAAGAHVPAASFELSMPDHLASTPAKAFSTSLNAFSADTLSLLAPIGLLGIFQPAKPGTEGNPGAWSMTTIGSVSLLLADLDNSDSFVVRLTGKGAEGLFGESSDSAWVGRRLDRDDAEEVPPPPQKFRAPRPELLDREKEDEPDRPCEEVMVEPPMMEEGREMDERPDLGKANAPILPPPLAAGLPLLPILIVRLCEGRPSIGPWP